MNPGFEERAPALTGWSAREAAGHSVALDSVDARGGRWAARVAGDADVAQNAFGIVTQRVDAAPFRGRMIRYRAWMRTDLAPGPGPGRAGLWLRVDRPDGRALRIRWRDGGANEYPPRYLRLRVSPQAAPELLPTGAPRVVPPS